MSEHTPGPWNYQATAGHHDFLVYRELTGRDVALVRDFDEGNAQLIAAAPDLLAALSHLHHVIITAPDAETLAGRLNSAVLDNARAAIAKAGG